jgi:hypothetical protein
MCYDLANRKNTLRKYSRLLSSCTTDELHILARVDNLEESRFYYNSILEYYNLANRENTLR